MSSRLDTIFWAYFDEYLKKDSSFSLRKLTIENKQRMNEVYEVTYYAIFQWQLAKSEPLLSLDPDKYNEIADYIIANYQRLLLFTFQVKKKSKFNLTEFEDLELIKEIIVKLVLVHINKTAWIDFKEKQLTNYYWLYSTVADLARKYQYDLSYKSYTKKTYHAITYPFLITMLVIDIFEPKDMLKKIKQVFSKENIILAFKDGRNLTTSEKEWILPQISLLKNEDDWNAFILNFSKEAWEALDNNRRFKLLHDLSRLTTIFLKDNLRNISLIGEGEEVFEILQNYLPIFLSNSNDKTKSDNKNESKQNIALLATNTKDYNSKWTIGHIEKFKDYRKLKYKSEKISDFIYRIKYASNYIDLIDMLSKSGVILSEKLITFKKVGLVNTLGIFSWVKDKYVKNYECVKFQEINLDHKNFEKMLIKAHRFEEIADEDSQISIMLRTITKMICLDYKAPKAFDYSWETLIKYYLIAFGPYKKNMTAFTIKNVDEIEYKVGKLLMQYKNLKQKNVVIDSVGVLYKLQNFM